MYPMTFFTQSNIQPKNGQCFVLMPFAASFREVYDAILQAMTGPELNFICTRADDQLGGGHIVEGILHSIGESEIIIADLTTRNANVFYELGISHMVKDIKKVLILTQNINDVPFDVHSFRCLVYEQSNTGLKQMQRALISAVLEVSKACYRFSVRNTEKYKFPHQLLGSDRCLYDFEFTEIWVGEDAAKFHIKEYRHRIGGPVTTINDDANGLVCGSDIALTNVAYRLVLEEVHSGTAYFRLIPR